MEIAKWSMILLYWLWLAIRNAHDNRKQHDWRLGVQILINMAVILLIIMDDRGMFVQMVGRIADGVAWFVNWIRGLISARA